MSAAEKDYAALMALGVTGEKKGVPVGSNTPKPQGLSIPGGITRRRLLQEYYSAHQAGNSPRAIKTVLDPMDPMTATATVTEGQNGGSSTFWFMKAAT